MYLMNVSNIVIFHMLVVDVLGYRLPLVFLSVLCWGFQHSSPNLRSGPAKKRSPALVQSCLPHSLAAQHLLAFQPKGRVVTSSTVPQDFSAEDDPIGSKEYNKKHPMKLMKTKGWCISEEGCFSYPKDQKGFWRKMHRIEKNRKKKNETTHLAPIRAPQCSFQPGFGLKLRSNFSTKKKQHSRCKRVHEYFQLFLGMGFPLHKPYIQLI